jgi:hypothetical protein
VGGAGIDLLVTLLDDQQQPTISHRTSPTPTHRRAFAVRTSHSGVAMVVLEEQEPHSTLRTTTSVSRVELDLMVPGHPP